MNGPFPEKRRRTLKQNPPDRFLGVLGVGAAIPANLQMQSQPLIPISVEMLRKYNQWRRSCKSLSRRDRRIALTIPCSTSYERCLLHQTADSFNLGHFTVFRKRKVGALPAHLQHGVCVFPLNHRKLVDYLRKEVLLNHYISLPLVALIAGYINWTEGKIVVRTSGTKKCMS